VRLRFERIPEEHQEVDLSVGDQRAELLVTAKRPALQLEDADAQRVLEERPSRAGADQIVAREQALVVLRPFDQVGLLLSCATRPILFRGLIVCSMGSPSRCGDGPPDSAPDNPLTAE
jgi:hypothetical protein